MTSVFLDECAQEADVALRLVDERAVDLFAVGRPMSVDTSMKLATRSSFSVGVELGLAIARESSDGAASWSRFFDEVVQEGDQEALAIVRRKARQFLEAAS